MRRHCSLYCPAGGKIRTGAVMFSSVYGLLGKTELADQLIEEATSR